MVSRIFPRVVDNSYRGHWLGIGLLALVALLKATQGIGILVNTHQTLTTADGIPVDTFAPDAAATTMGMFALLGMYTLLMPLLSLVTLVRWRALVPFMLSLFLVIQIGSRVIQTVFPIPRSADPDFSFAGHPIGFWVNLVILAVTVIGLLLSLMNRPPKPALAQGPHQ